VLQVFGETAMLAALAVAIGIPVAFFTLAAVRVLIGPMIHGATTIALDYRTFALLALLAFVAAMVCGLAPALSAGTRALTALRAGSAPTEGRAWQRIRSTIVVVQISTAIAILVTASAIARTVSELAAADVGTHNESALVMEVLLPQAAYQSSDRIVRFHERVREELRHVPGVEEAGATAHAPGVTNVITPSVPVTVDHHPLPPDRSGAVALRLSATPGYFSAAGIDLLAGRTFNDTDVRAARPVAVVSEGYARTVGLKVSDILGQRLQAGLSEDRWAEVVGVVRDVRMRGPESDWQPAMYLPFAQIRVNATTFLVVKLRFGDRPPIAAIRSAVARVDPTIPLYNIRTLADIREEYLSSRRFAMISVVSFGGVTFTLAFLGLFAVVHYMVRLRTREIGIRMAAGASPVLVRRQVLTSGTWHTFAGITLGALFASATLRVAAASIPNLKDVSLGMLLSLCVVTFVVSIGTAWFPARRASQVDPLLALRSD
jgi:predicted permease